MCLGDVSFLKINSISLKKENDIKKYFIKFKDDSSFKVFESLPRERCINSPREDIVNIEIQIYVVNSDNIQSDIFTKNVEVNGPKICSDNSALCEGAYPFCIGDDWDDSPDDKPEL